MAGFSAIGLVRPKTDANVGGVMRAAHCYGAAMIAIQGKRYRREPTDTFKSWSHIPVIHADDLHTVIPLDCVPVAVDLIPGAIPLQEYRHPKRAFYVFGPEDGTLGASVTSWCRDAVFVPTIGCMNLAATANVVLYDRLAKGE